MLKTVLYITLTLLGMGYTLFWPAAGVVSCIGAYLLNPVAFGGEVGFRYQFWTMVVFVVSLLIYRPSGLQRVGREAWPLYLLWAYIALAAIGGFFAEIDSDLAFQALYEVFKTVLFTALLTLALNSERAVSWTIKACVLGILHASILFTFGVRFGYVPHSLGRGASGVMPDPQAGVTVLFVPLLLIMALRGSTKERLLAWLAIPFVLDGAVETYERTALVAIAVEGLILLLFLPRRLTLRILPVLAIAGALFVFRLAPPDYWEKMGTILTPHEEGSAASRFVINDASWRMFKDHPLGVGYRNYPWVSPRYLDAGYLTVDDQGEGVRAAHNTFFSVLCESGLHGFLIWAGAFGGALLIFRKIRKGADPANPTAIEIYAMGLEVGLYGWLAGGWFQSYQEVDPAFWFVGLAVVLRRLQIQMKGEAEEQAETAMPVPQPA